MEKLPPETIMNFILKLAQAPNITDDFAAQHIYVNMRRLEMNHPDYFLPHGLEALSPSSFSQLTKRLPEEAKSRLEKGIELYIAEKKAKH